MKAVSDLNWKNVAGQNQKWNFFFLPAKFDYWQLTVIFQAEMCLSFIIFNFWELIFGLKRDCHFRFRFQFRLPALHLIFAQTSVGGIEYAKYQMLSVYCPDIYILCLVRFWVWNDRNQLKTGQPRRSKNFQQISTVDQLCAVVFQ